MSEVPPKGEYASGILLLFFSYGHLSYTLIREGKFQSPEILQQDETQTSDVGIMTSPIPKYIP